MSRYIDAEHIPNDKFFKDLTDVEKAKVLLWFAQALTADVVEVVRCEDCKHFQFSDMFYMYGECSRDIRIVKPDGFCSYGERKDTK